MPVRGEHALALLYPGYARWQGMWHKGLLRSPRSRLSKLAARTPRTKGSSEPLRVPIVGVDVPVSKAPTAGAQQLSIQKPQPSVSLYAISNVV